jgi:hypothetical protein
MVSIATMSKWPTVEAVASGVHSESMGGDDVEVSEAGDEVMATAWSVVVQCRVGGASLRFSTSRRSDRD